MLYGIDQHVCYVDAAVLGTKLREVNELLLHCQEEITTQDLCNAHKTS